MNIVLRLKHHKYCAVEQISVASAVHLFKKFKTVFENKRTRKKKARIIFQVSTYSSYGEYSQIFVSENAQLWRDVQGA